MFLTALTCSQILIEDIKPLMLHHHHETTELENGEVALLSKTLDTTHLRIEVFACMLWSTKGAGIQAEGLNLILCICTGPLFVSDLRIRLQESQGSKRRASISSSASLAPASASSAKNAWAKIRGMSRSAQVDCTAHLAVSPFLVFTQNGLSHSKHTGAGLSKRCGNVSEVVKWLRAEHCDRARHA